MKRAITGIAAAALTLGTIAPAAFAATASAPSYFGSQIHVGSYNTNVQALKVQDAGNTTALFPFYYIQQGLKAAGYSVTWDGVAKRLDIVTPDGVTFDKSNLNPGVGAVGIYINGTLVQRAPFQVAKDMGGNKQATSFMAAYYLNQALSHIGFTNTYDGTGAGWTLTAPQLTGTTASAVTVSAANASLVANGVSTDTITVKAVDANGHVVPSYNGPMTISYPTNATLETLGGTLITNAAGTATVTATNGVASFNLVSTGASVAGLSDTITATYLPPNASNTVSASTTVNYVAQAATAVGLGVRSGYPSGISVNTAGQSTQVKLTINDSTGTPLISGGAYVTLTLSGPGSFSNSSSVTTETVWVSGTTTYQTVYGLQGQTGNITISAASTGLSGSSVTVPAVVNTAAHALKVVKSGSDTDSNGVPYTIYTVSLVDTNGNVISNASSETANITDDADGTLGYFGYNGITIGGSATTVTLTNGVGQFAVETTSPGTGSPTITVTDANGMTGSAGYAYATGAAYKAAFLATTVGQSVQAGSNVSVQVQLEDANNNPVAKAGEAVTFTLTGTSSAKFPNGSTSTYTAVTSSDGKATVTLSVPSSAVVPGTVVVTASYNGQNSSPLTENIVAAQNSATSLAWATTYAPVDKTQSAGQAFANVPVVDLLNAIGTAATTNDTIEVLTSNPAVVQLSGWTAAPGVSDGSAVVETLSAASTVTLPTMTAHNAGTATITVKDLSAPSQPSVTVNLSSVPTNIWSADVVQSQGKTVSASNPLTVAANTPVAITVVRTDAGGNPVPVTGSSSQWVGLNDGGKGGQFRTTPNGVAVTEVAIPAGQTSVTLYYVNSSAATVTAFGTDESVAAPATGSLAWTQPTPSASGVYTAVNLTGLKDSNGALYNGSVTFTVSGSHGAKLSTANPGTPATSVTVTVTNGAASFFYVSGTPVVSPTPTSVDTVSSTTAAFTINSLQTGAY